MRKPDQDSSKYVPITQEMISHLVELKNKTRTGFHALYKHGKINTDHEVFRDTTNTLPNMWITGKSKTVNIEHYNAIVSTYESLPGKRTGSCGSIKIAVTPKFQDQLNEFFNAPRALSAQKILLYNKAPKGLTPALISNIINGKTLSINIEYAEYLSQLARNKPKML